MKALAAILIHAIGFYVIDSLIPDWVEAAGAWLLAKWYFAFFFVDLSALAIIGRSCVSYILAVSATWSLVLCVEQLFLADQLQQLDQLVQKGIDIALAVMAVLIMLKLIRARFRKDKTA